MKKSPKVRSTSNGNGKRKNNPELRNIGFKLNPPQHYTQLPNTNFRYLYPRQMTDAVLSGSMSVLLEKLSIFCDENVITTFYYDDGPYRSRHFEFKGELIRCIFYFLYVCDQSLMCDVFFFLSPNTGIQAMAEFFIGHVLAAPDVVVTLNKDIRCECVYVYVCMFVCVCGMCACSV